MLVYLNQGNRSLRPVNVSTDRGSVQFLLPEGYNGTYTRYIGSGTYGTVIRTNATSARTNSGRGGTEQEVAIKKINYPMENERLAQLCYREMMLLQHLDHPNIARLVDMYTSAQHANELLDVYLVMEYVGSSLDAQLVESIKDNRVYVPIAIIPQIIRDTLRALNYLKHANVIHRDLKPSNLAVHSSGRAVLIDYGLARTGRTEEDRSCQFTKGACTMAYAAPELVFWEEGSYDREADIWSLGCILAELITWESLFTDDKSKVVNYITLFQPISDNFLSKVKTSDGGSMRRYIEEKNKKLARMNWVDYFKSRNKFANLNDPNQAAALDLVWRCLQYDPESRISINDALRHPFLQNIRNGDPERDYSNVRPLVYNDSRDNIEKWRQAVFGEIWNFRAREDTPRPARP
ncbi:hypothetical protein PMAYCL1PPCAC_09774 [Pristionchus mayeri]|uniref:Protein kinase domain-containing protein n=1 Tax=Pristionchus mayeri TaxID=1317129 RepID=A0AAN4ZGL9_9BILA|nr:hypothetical protein PMAYCL1PPCAC_09774 [Pristionchus mayeri]